MTHARLTVLVGPSGVGKGTVVSALKERHPELVVSVSATTRDPRPGEEHGVNYLFITEEEFDELLRNDGLLEWAQVFGGNRYGTPRGPVEEHLAAGRPVLLEIDLEGARQVRLAMPEAQLVFLAPPSWEELERRLIGRGTETPEQQQRRLTTARTELAAQAEFDTTVVNDDVERAAMELAALMGLK
ncbi:guanylate kinase [Schaalia canis]|uniref:Guanylate kinase n=1 Tax=Schaalia canis TaxID=100469 RepID=A0A3P1SG90_9ACTO|nr:guanylate kinase [Schaalia canis]RRC96168.1 guanylate kinase [Schaalia canis]